MAHLKHKKKLRFLKQAKYWFPKIETWFFIRIDSRPSHIHEKTNTKLWVMKMNSTDPAGFIPEQYSRIPRRLKT